MVKTSGREDLHNSNTQMKVFRSIPAAVVLSGSLIATATPATAYESYRVTPTYTGGYRIYGSNGYRGRLRPDYTDGGTSRNSSGGGFRYRPNYTGGRTNTFY